MNAGNSSWYFCLLICYEFLICSDVHLIDIFQSLTKPTEHEEEEGQENNSDSENTPPAVRPGKRRLKATQRSLPGEVDTAKRSLVAEVQPILLGYRWPEGSQSNSSPESIILWR